MTKWKDLMDTNPEPSLLDAIAHAEKKDAPGLHEFLKAWVENYGLSVVDAPNPKGDDK
jgi:hypothetical protein